MGSHISLFAGVGMTDIATEKFGFSTIATAEIDPWNRSVLQKRFPRARHFADVRHVSVSNPHWPHPGDIARPLLVSGGFPCQDVASSGTGLGLNGSRSGLWSEFARVIREFQPEYVLIENSALLRKRGLDRVLCDLAAMGYDARWDCIPAAAVGAPHMRDRMFVVAWKDNNTLDTPHAEYFAFTASHGLVFPSTKTDLPRAGGMWTGSLYYVEPQATVSQARQNAKVRLFPTPTKSDGSGGPGVTPKREGGKNLRTVIGEEEGNGRLNPAWVEWMLGLPIGWTDPKLRNQQLGMIESWHREPYPLLFPRTVRRQMPDRGKRIRALGNGLVWPCALRALQMIPDLEGAIR